MCFNSSVYQSYTFLVRFITEYFIVINASFMAQPPIPGPAGHDQVQDCHTLSCFKRHHSESQYEQWPLVSFNGKQFSDQWASLNIPARCMPAFNRKNHLSRGWGSGRLSLGKWGCVFSICFSFVFPATFSLLLKQCLCFGELLLFLSMWFWWES